MAPGSVTERKGEPLVISTDVGIRANTTIETLAKLRPAFAKDCGTTAGNSSQISDAAALHEQPANASSKAFAKEAFPL
jgi:acetyl-CoA C-acetyltransferase